MGRARIAKEEILKLNMDHCNSNGITIATGEDAQVTQAFTLGVVKTAKEVHYLQLLIKNVDVFIPAEGDGLIITRKALQGI